MRSGVAGIAAGRRGSGHAQHRGFDAGRERKGGEMRTGMRRGARPGAVATTAAMLALWAVGLWATSASADLQRVEAVGTYGIDSAKRGRVVARDAAIRDARREAVTRVALERIGTSEWDDDGGALQSPLESGGDPNDVRRGRVSPTEDEAATLAEALGADMLPYTRSYRLLEDQGERPVLFEDRPGIETEYVVVVQVVVDVERVEQALERAGLVAAMGVGEGETLLVEFEGIRRYAVFDRLLRTLRSRLGATKAAALEFSLGRQLVAVEGPFGGEELARRLSRLEDPDFRLEPVALDRASGRLRIRAEPASARFEASGSSDDEG